MSAARDLCAFRIVARHKLTIPLPLAAGEIARVVAAAEQQPSAALEITDRVAAVVGQIARPVLADGEVVAVAGVGAAAAAALVAGGN